MLPNNRRINSISQKGLETLIFQNTGVFTLVVHSEFNETIIISNFLSKDTEKYKVFTSEQNYSTTNVKEVSCSKSNTMVGFLHFNADVIEGVRFSPIKFLEKMKNKFKLTISRINKERSRSMIIKIFKGTKFFSFLGKDEIPKICVRFGMDVHKDIQTKILLASLKRDYINFVLEIEGIKFITKEIIVKFVMPHPELRSLRLNIPPVHTDIQMRQLSAKKENISSALVTNDMTKEKFDVLENAFEKREEAILTIKKVVRDYQLDDIDFTESTENCFTPIKTTYERKVKKLKSKLTLEKICIELNAKQKLDSMKIFLKRSHLKQEIEKMKRKILMDLENLTSKRLEAQDSFDEETRLLLRKEKLLEKIGSKSPKLCKMMKEHEEIGEVLIRKSMLIMTMNMKRNNDLWFMGALTKGLNVIRKEIMTNVMMIVNTIVKPNMN